MTNDQVNTLVRFHCITLFDKFFNGKMKHPFWDNLKKNQMRYKALINFNFNIEKIQLLIVGTFLYQINIWKLSQNI